MHMSSFVLQNTYIAKQIIFQFCTFLKCSSGDLRHALRTITKQYYPLIFILVKYLTQKTIP